MVSYKLQARRLAARLNDGDPERINMDQQDLEVLVKRIERMERRSQRMLVGFLFVMALLVLGAAARRVRAQDGIRGTNLSVSVDPLRRVACYSFSKTTGETGGALSCVSIK